MVEDKAKDGLETKSNHRAESKSTPVTIFEVDDLGAKAIIMGTGGATVMALKKSSGAVIHINHGVKTVAIYGSEVAQVLALRLIHAKLRLNGFSYTVLTPTE